MCIRDSPRPDSTSRVINHIVFFLAGAFTVVAMRVTLFEKYRTTSVLNIEIVCKIWIRSKLLPPG